MTWLFGVSELEVDKVLLFSAVFQQQEDDGVADEPAGPAGWSAGGEFECVCSTSLDPFSGKESGDEDPDVRGYGQAGAGAECEDAEEDLCGLSD